MSSTSEKITLNKIPSARKAAKMSEKVAGPTKEYKEILDKIQDAINAGKTFISDDRATLSSDMVKNLRKLDYWVDIGRGDCGYTVSWACADNSEDSEEE